MIKSLHFSYVKTLRHCKGLVFVSIGRSLHNIVYMDTNELLINDSHLLLTPTNIIHSV